MITTITLRVRDGRITVNQVRRARRTLCGKAGCTCGGSLGERGPQEGHPGLLPECDGTWRVEA